MKKILFINHSTSRTGAPMMLLHFLEWLKHQKDVSFDVLSLDNGDLLDSFTLVSKQHFYKKKKVNLFLKVTRYLKNKIYQSEDSRILYPEHALKSIAKNRYSLIYANTILSIPAGKYIKKHSNINSKLLVHFHELNITINQFCPELKIYQPDIDFSIAASYKVKDNLIENWGFKEHTTKVVYEHSKIALDVSKTSKEFIIGASGLVNWRKGPDFFILVAQYVFKKLPDAPIKFQWVGRISKLNRLIYEEDISRLNLIDKVVFTGAKDNPHDYYSEFDMFLMTSKEDPFPLVCIEVGMMGKPIVCFKGSTGTEEVLTNVEAAVVPYLDIEKMGEVVIRYFKNENFRLETGQKMKHIFKEFTPEKQGVKLCDIIDNVIGNSNN